MRIRGKCLPVLAACALIQCVTTGCDLDRDEGVDRLWDDSKVPLLARFEGEWKFDEERTFKAWQAAGMSDEALAQARAANAQLREAMNSEQLAKEIRQLGLDPKEFQQAHGQMHTDLTFAANAATGAGLVKAEYRFFNLHQHGETICGKAWHHEDKDDPGDMSKCYVQLAIKDGELHMKVRMQDGEVDLEDPDFNDPPPIVADSAAEKCDAEKPAGSDWDEWTTLVFVRPGASKK